MTEAAMTQVLRAYPSIGVAWQRLADYLGNDFDPALTEFGRCCEFVESEFDLLGSAFYEQSIGYLYELTHFHFSTYKDPFFELVIGVASRLGVRRLADVGCGIGLDAQALSALRFQVAMFDVDCPSTRYASWRMAHEGLSNIPVRPFNELGTDRFDLVYAVDVLEHVADPVPFIRRLFDTAGLVCVNLFEHDPSAWDGRDMHFPLDHWTLLPAFAQHGDLIQLGISGATVTTLWRRRE